MQVRQDGVGYRVRRVGSAPFALAVFMVLGLGFVIAVDRNRAARLNSFGDAVLGDAAPPDIRAAETRIRWADLLRVLVGAAGLGWLLSAKPY